MNFEIGTELFHSVDLNIGIGIEESINFQFEMELFHSVDLKIGIVVGER